MPTVTETHVSGFASCPDAQCPGHEEVQVSVRRREKQFSFAELGGDLPGIERSMIDAVDVTDPTDAACSYCAKTRLVSLEPRPEYPKSSGQDPLRLLNLTHDKAVRDMQISGLERDKEMAELRATVAELRADRAQDTRSAPSGAPGAPKPGPSK